MNFYRMREAPFSVTPDPAFVYWSPSHKEALAAITHGVAEGKGFIAVTGEVGSGKTTMLRSFLARREAARIDAAYLLDPELDFEALLRAIFREFDLGEAPRELDEAVERLQRYLIARHEANKRVVLLIDEAQRMPVDTLERLRVLSNLETDKEKLLQIILCGQPEFDALIERHALRQLRQRIAVRARLAPLTRTESRAYIAHRLECAGAEVREVFTPGALHLLARHGRGSPRQLNLLCDNALIEGFAGHRRPVPARVVKSGIRDFVPPRRSVLRRLAAAAVAVVLAGVAGGVVLAVRAPEESGDAATWREQLAAWVAPEGESAERGSPGPSAERGSPDPFAVRGSPDPAQDLTEGLQPHEATPESDKFAGRESPDPAQDLTEGLQPRGATPEERAAPAPEVEEEIEAKGSPFGEPEAAPVPESAPETFAPSRVLKAPAPDVSGIGAVLEVEVAHGDSLWKLLHRAYGTPRPDLVDEVLALNPALEDADLLAPGQVLRIPAPPEAGAQQ